MIIKKNVKQIKTSSLFVSLPERIRWMLNYVVICNMFSIQLLSRNQELRETICESRLWTCIHPCAITHKIPEETNANDNHWSLRWLERSSTGYHASKLFAFKTNWEHSGTAQLVFSSGITKDEGNRLRTVTVLKGWSIYNLKTN